jgi:hypothetical protein
MHNKFSLILINKHIALGRIRVYKKMFIDIDEMLPSKNTNTGFKYLCVVCEKKDYYYYNVDIKKKGQRFRKRFEYNENGLGEALKFIKLKNELLSI